MRNLRSDQSGIVAILLVLIVAVLIGLLVWRVVDVNKRVKPTNETVEQGLNTPLQ